MEEQKPIRPGSPEHIAYRAEEDARKEGRALTRIGRDVRCAVRAHFVRYGTCPSWATPIIRRVHSELTLRDDDDPEMRTNDMLDVVFGKDFLLKTLEARLQHKDLSGELPGKGVLNGWPERSEDDEDACETAAIS